MLDILGGLKGLFLACPDFPECGTNAKCCDKKRKEMAQIQAEAMAAAMQQPSTGAGLFDSLGIPEEYRKYVLWGGITLLGVFVIKTVMN